MRGCRCYRAKNKLLMCSKLAIEIPERHHWHHFDFSVFNFENFQYINVVILLLAFNVCLPLGKEQID